MESDFVLVSWNKNGKVVRLNTGENFIGRELTNSDKRCSVKQLLLVCSTSGITIEIIGKNPMCILRSDGTQREFLKRHHSLPLYEGDSFSMLLDLYWYLLEKRPFNTQSNFSPNTLSPHNTSTTESTLPEFKETSKKRQPTDSLLGSESTLKRIKTKELSSSVHCIDPARDHDQTSDSFLKELMDEEAETERKKKEQEEADEIFARQLQQEEETSRKSLTKSTSSCEIITDHSKQQNISSSKNSFRFTPTVHNSSPAFNPFSTNTTSLSPEIPGNSSIYSSDIVTSQLPKVKTSKPHIEQSSEPPPESHFQNKESNGKEQKMNTRKSKKSIDLELSSDEEAKDLLSSEPDSSSTDLIVPEQSYSKHWLSSESKSKSKSKKKRGTIWTPN